MSQTSAGARWGQVDPGRMKSVHPRRHDSLEADPVLGAFRYETTSSELPSERVASEPHVDATQTRKQSCARLKRRASRHG